MCTRCVRDVNVRAGAACIKTDMGTQVGVKKSRRKRITAGNCVLSLGPAKPDTVASCNSVSTECNRVSRRLGILWNSWRPSLASADCRTSMGCRIGLGRTPRSLPLNRRPRLAHSSSSTYQSSSSPACQHTEDRRQASQRSTFWGYSLSTNVFWLRSPDDTRPDENLNRVVRKG